MNIFDLSVESFTLFNNAVSQALTPVPLSCIGVVGIDNYINTSNIAYDLSICNQNLVQCLNNSQHICSLHLIPSPIILGAKDLNNTLT